MFLLKDYIEQNPQFAETIRILEPYDPGTAESVNVATKQLLQNDLFLKKKVESDKQELSNLIQSTKQELSGSINSDKQELINNLNSLSQNMSQEINKKANSSELKQVAYTANFNDLVNKPPSMLYLDTEPDVAINGSLWIG